MRRRLVIGLLLLTVAPAAAKDAFPKDMHGLWGLSAAECADDDGPNANTYIEGDLFDQYENHCRLRSIGCEGAVTVARMACEAEGQKYARVVRLDRTTAGRLVLSEDATKWSRARRESFQRCEKPASTKG